MRLLTLLVALLTAAAIALACGGEESDEDRIESTVRTFMEHYSESRIEAMYAMLDTGSRELCSESNFVAFMSAAREALGDEGAEIVDVGDIAVEGDRATATIQSRFGAEVETTQNTLIKEDGEWRLQLPSIGC